MKKEKVIKNSKRTDRTNIEIDLSKTMAEPDLLSDEQKLFQDRSEENEDNRLRVEDIKQSLHRLTPNELQVIQLLGSGKTHEEVSFLLEISKGNVSTLLGRARKKIKKFVGQNGVSGVLYEEGMED